MGYSKNQLKRIWQQAPECRCADESCHPNNHRLCYRCQKTILFGSYWGNESQRNSRYVWDIDHVEPRSKNGSSDIANLRPICVNCNRTKGNKSPR